jgi:hypothetical protein
VGVEDVLAVGVVREDAVYEAAVVDAAEEVSEDVSECALG